MSIEMKPLSEQPKDLKSLNANELVEWRGKIQRVLMPSWLEKFSALDPDEQEQGLEKYLIAFAALYPGPKQSGVEKTERLMSRWNDAKSEEDRHQIITEVSEEIEQYLQSQRS